MIPANAHGDALADRERLVDARLRIAGLIELLNLDELEVAELVIHGLVRGRSVYGPLNIATDKRDWREEAGEELRDSLIYSAAGLLRLRSAGKR